ncbi:hypothetical protein A3C59_04385 [Candidatus Daviesbacteria bacterium RIFCSPHIGHO2_02_FULL_36_13]|uniref:Inositol monophosphatase n=1 Tax=Candidatus Daviesbacteria bacterium RIFCSPHIGHO2_02_FULL_36_13 TaxID=1797768 RepID=A0A1F5JW24_9BACT|nr:MAG: hypothetical protein A3C59_04385 [Candidatus Daviesbacteria bacterium RIFCSPHIGHO2_02_FULL_36_13]OGE40910.1 MAG: hypothetical protein A3A45_01165 [Candidatus Daviesbacteria bacterium RIFCSPLOWO2_01_FULL_36_8]
MNLNEFSKNKNEVLKVMFKASEMAWQKAIKPRMKKIREDSVDKSSIKGGGTDFFTEADTESERVVKEELIKRFGKDVFRIFGEEENGYIGNLESDITIRIDPIDGTEAFKFGKPNWSILIGVYSGRDDQEKQLLATIYYPEYYNEMLYFLEGSGIFLQNMSTGEKQEITNIEDQDSLENIIVAYWKNSNLQKRGRIDEILDELEKNGARVRSISPTEVKEALITHGKRAMIMDGDYNQVDFISYSLLIKLGYKVYDWNGSEYNINDPGLTDKKLVIIPPGKAGKQILEIVNQNK